MMALEWNGQPFESNSWRSGGQSFPALLDWGRVPNTYMYTGWPDRTERWQFEMNNGVYSIRDNEYVGPYTMTFGAPQLVTGM